MKRILKGRVSRRDREHGTHALVEDWGGILSAVAYGSEAAMRALQAKLDYKTELHEVCAKCGAAKPECVCASS